MAWNDERVELLKRFWSEGLSASQIASKMGGVTRNAVIGKVHRLGLSGRATPAKPQRGCDPECRIEEDQTPVVHARSEIERLIVEPEFIAPAILATGDMATVATLKGNMCKWPIGDPAKDDFHFCGQSAPTGKPYCAYHAQMAFQPAQRRPDRPVQPAARVIADAARRRASN
ncbi:MAG: GcrA family cell cycle regulator [Pseudomonadota bacterium]